MRGSPGLVYRSSTCLGRDDDGSVDVSHLIRSFFLIEQMMLLMDDDAWGNEINTIRQKLYTNLEIHLSKHIFIDLNKWLYLRE